MDTLSYELKGKGLEEPDVFATADNIKRHHAELEALRFDKHGDELCHILDFIFDSSVLHTDHELDEYKQNKDGTFRYTYLLTFEYQTDKSFLEK